MNFTSGSVGHKEQLDADLHQHSCKSTATELSESVTQDPSFQILYTSRQPDKHHFAQKLDLILKNKRCGSKQTKNQITSKSSKDIKIKHTPNSANHDDAVRKGKEAHNTVRNVKECWFQSKEMTNSGLLSFKSKEDIEKTTNGELTIVSKQSEDSSKSNISGDSHQTQRSRTGSHRALSNGLDLKMDRSTASESNLKSVCNLCGQKIKVIFFSYSKFFFCKDLFRNKTTNTNYFEVSAFDIHRCM